MNYGLIGEKLGHSFSKPIHEQLADYEYSLMPLAQEEFDAFMRAKNFKAINVTIPYKQQAMSYCDEIDENARIIGAVNTVVNDAGRLVGYNSDYAGLRWLLQNGGVCLRGKTVLLLGNGATAKTACAVAQAGGAAHVLVASGHPMGELLSYEQAMRRKDVQVIINTSPAGMYPNNLAAPLVELASFPRLEAVADVIYNPMKTRLLMQAQALGIPALNGLGMLVAQAKVSCEYFLKKSLPENAIHDVKRSMLRRLTNVTLIGMPGCGKTSLGRVLAKRLGRRFVDTDKCVVQKAGKSIPDIFKEQGEDVFRDLESAAAKEMGALNGLVIATGGGIVKRKENIEALRQNGMVFFINCKEVDLAVGKGRPLSKTKEDVHQLAKERLPLYHAVADAVVDYHESFNENVARLGYAFEEAIKTIE